MGVDPLMRRAVFLDRDGVLNRAVVRDGRPYPPASLAQLELLPGVPDALARLREAGFVLLVVTNQPDVARGTRTRAAVEELHTALREWLPLDAIYACYHDDADGCDCRKPKPGMLHTAAHVYGLDLASSFLVGDRWRDIEAGKQAGCTTLFIDYQYDEPERSQPHVRVRSLAEAADWIITLSSAKDMCI
jgi:D-glycero-D-manno-heptose 1,7-bisphosphate phosphatase